MSRRHPRSRIPSPSLCASPHPTRWLALGALLLAALGAPARAQDPSQSLNEAALAWARGHYASPLLCEFDGKPVRGIRRIVIAPGPRSAHPPVGRIDFVDLEAGEATRCMTDLGVPQPNLIGGLQIRLPSGYDPSDTLAREFKSALRRDRGFEFTIPAGAVQAATIGGNDEAPRVIDFRGGHASLRLVAPGTDAERALREFVSARKALLTITAPDATELSFPLFVPSTP